jgi:transposase-like protein
MSARADNRHLQLCHAALTTAPRTYPQARLQLSCSRSPAWQRRLAHMQTAAPKAVTTLEKDADVLLTFYDFPAEHWKHLRTSNVIESRSRPCGCASA